MPILREDDNWPNVKKSQHPIKDILKYALIIWLAHELSKDFCFEQHRKLTDKEYISIVLSSLLKSGHMQTHSMDNTVDSYLAHHPNCCAVSRNDPYFRIYPFGYEVLITIKYEMSDSYDLKKRSHDTHYEYLSVKTACGEHIFSSGETFTPPNTYN
jgi:hypothetical protein